MFVYDVFRAMPPPAQLLGTRVADNSLTAADVVYSLDDAYKFEGGIRALSAAAGAVDAAYFVSDSVNLYGTLVKNVS
jgi:hypothetical protein